MIQKRYQYWSPNGIVWTHWFDTNLKDIDNQPKNQLGNLKNQYRTI